MIPLSWVVLMTALSGFFSLTSYALRAFRRTHLEDAFESGGSRSNGRAVAGRERLDRLERHLTPLRLTASFCRLVSNFALVMAVLHAFDAPTSLSAKSLGALVVVTALVGVFGVAIPHAWACHGGEKVLAATLGPMMALRYALYPVVAAMQMFDVPIRRLTGAGDPEDEAETAKQEIIQAATDGHAEGAVNAEEMEMIESVIEFRETHAGEIMTPRTDIFALPVTMQWQEACRQVFAAGHTRVPVYEGDLDNIIGVLYAKDLLEHVQSSEPIQIRDIMRRPFFVPETKRLDDLLREFKARKVHLAVILDEYGGTAGLITIEDVLEEIVGEIADEYDQAETSPVKRIDERTVEVDGRIHIDELNDALELEIPEDEDYDTVAGLVFSNMGYVPSVGENFRAYGASFTVLVADDRKISRLRVERLDEPTDDED